MTARFIATWDNRTLTIHGGLFGETCKFACLSASLGYLIRKTILLLRSGVSFSFLSLIVIFFLFLHLQIGALG